MTARYTASPAPASTHGATSLPAAPPTGISAADQRLVLRRSPAAAPGGPQVTAPAKPSAAMLALGAEAGGVSVEVAWRIYRAMIEAAG